MAFRATLAALVLAFTVAPATALVVDITTIVSNPGFEAGNLSGWTVTRPNSTFVASLSPPVNPTIDPADPANDTTTLTAPDGAFFTGLKRPGDTGPDLKYKLAHDATSVLFPTGTIFQVTVFANKGRLEPFDTPPNPASTGDVLVRIFGWGAGSLPTVDPTNDDWSRSISWNPLAQSFDFTGVLDGTWAARTFLFDPAALGFDSANLRFLTLSITARNMNHDQYIATDVDLTPPVPAPPSILLLSLALTGLGLIPRKRRRA